MGKRGISVEQNIIDRVYTIYRQSIQLKGEPDKAYKITKQVKDELGCKLGLNTVKKLMAEWATQGEQTGKGTAIDPTTLDGRIQLNKDAIVAADTRLFDSIKSMAIRDLLSYRTQLIMENLRFTEMMGTTDKKDKSVFDEILKETEDS